MSTPGKPRRASVGWSGRRAVRLDCLCRVQRLTAEGQLLNVLVCQVIRQVFKPVAVNRAIGLSFHVTLQQRHQLERRCGLLLIHLSRVVGLNQLPPVPPDASDLSTGW